MKLMVPLTLLAFIDVAFAAPVPQGGIGYVLDPPDDPNGTGPFPYPDPLPDYPPISPDAI